jgi:hypothetical protein
MLKEVDIHSCLIELYAFSDATQVLADFPLI